MCQCSLPTQMQKEVSFIPINLIHPFYNVLCPLCNNEELSEQIKSITKDEMNIPILVLKVEDKYELLSGHSRVIAANTIGLVKVPAIVKYDLSKEEIYTYIIEDNVIQKTFAGLLPTEKAELLEWRYKHFSSVKNYAKMIYELEVVNGTKNVDANYYAKLKIKSREDVAAMCGFSSRNAAKYIRLNYLNDFFKEMIDQGKITLAKAVNISYMSLEEQDELEYDFLLYEDILQKLKKIPEDKVNELIKNLSISKTKDASLEITIPKVFYEEYFDDLDEEDLRIMIIQGLLDYSKKDDIF